MFYRNKSAYLVPALLVLLTTVVFAGRAACDAPPLAASSEPGDSPPRLQVVLLNGGGQPSINYYSHFRHIKQFTEIVRRAGISSSDITIFNADGAAPQADFAVRDTQAESAFWLLEGTPLERPLRPQIRFENSTIDGFSLQPATRAALQSWFEAAAQRLRPGDTLLFYVTDHGTKNAEDLTNNRITLWGEQETISVSELRELFTRLDRHVRIVVLMSQCFSGSFANLIYGGSSGELPTGKVCGFFSSTADRQAYGCYPENRDKDNVGHSFAFIEHLAAGYSLPEAHNGILVTDQTPDVPLKTSDAYLEKQLEQVARARGEKLDVVIDELLTRAWRDKGAWEPELRLLDRIGQTFGYFSPRSVAELQEQAQRLLDLSEQFSTYSKAWASALHALAGENLQRFLAQKPHWRERLDEKTLSSLAETERRTLVSLLLTDLEDFTRSDAATMARLQLLREKSRSASNAHYRMQVRLGVVLRMRAILTSIAGRMYLTHDEMAAQRKSFAELQACETLTVGVTDVATRTPVPPEQFPSYEGERKLAEAVLPAYLGVSFTQASAIVRTKFSLKNGATLIQAVYPDSPAKHAGIEAGDIILGPPDAPFTEPYQIREWTMTAPIGTPTALQILRGNETLRLSLTPQSYPLKWPSLPGPPKVGSTMPSLRGLIPYRGTLPSALESGGPYLLFFWATWCGPCKASLPEVVAFEREKGIPVIAITDEPAEQLDAFFKKYEGPFPAIVAVDQLRKLFLAYGVSGTPTFILADAAGKVQSTAVGYSAEKGLPFTGWIWTKRIPGPTQGSHPE